MDRRSVGSTQRKKASSPPTGGLSADPVARPTSQDQSADWIQPPAHDQGISRYVETLRERTWVVVAAVVITTGIAMLYVLTATKTYEAEADILVTPVPAGSTTLQSLGLISTSSEPLREIETVARLLTTNEVAASALPKLQALPEAADTDELLTHVSAEPVAESNIVAISATAETPESAAQIANVFVDTAIADRTDQLHSRVETAIAQLTTQLQGNPPDGDALKAQLAELRLLQSQNDPTLQVASRAEPPTRQLSPRPALSVAGGLLAGLILGIGAAFAYQALDPRLRREEQLRRLYRLPILARIPREGTDNPAPLSPTALSPAAGEAYRTLRGTLAAAARRGRTDGRVILVTGSSPSEGKTTTAVNLATSLALSGKRVVMIEADLRRPAIREALGVPQGPGVVSVLIESTTIDEALITTKTYGANLGLLLADYESDWVSELFSLPSTAHMIEQARARADFVIIDSPPLTDVVDALPLTTYVDDVLIVVRLGKTRLDKLSQLGELFAEIGVRPVGFALVGTPRPTKSDYHYYRDRDVILSGTSARPR